MKNPQTWSISIACISSVALAIGLAVVSAQDAKQDNNKIQETGAVPDDVFQEVIKRSEHVHIEPAPFSADTPFAYYLQAAQDSHPSSPQALMNSDKNTEFSSSIKTGENTNIKLLMTQVNVDLAESRLTLPLGNNAWEKLQHILKQDPGNIEARNKLEFIMTSYVQMAKRAANDGDDLRQQHYLDQMQLVLFGEKSTRSQLAENISSTHFALN